MFYPNINRLRAAERAEKCRFLSMVTVTFDLDLQTRVRAMDQTRLPCEFGANPFSGSRYISYTNKTQTDCAKNRTFRSSQRTVKTHSI